MEGSTENSLHYRLLTKQRTVLDDLQHLPISHLPPAPQSVLTFSHSDEVLRVSSKQGGMDEIAIDHLKRYPLASMFNVYANHDARLLKGDKNDKEPNNNSNSLPMSPSNGNLTSPTSKSVVSASESKNPDEMEVTGPEQIDEELKPAQDCILGSDLALQQIISHWEHPMSYCLQSVPPTQFTIESITPNGSIESVATNNLSLGQQLFADPSKYTPAFKSLLKSSQLIKEELPKGEDDILNATRGRCYVDVWGEESFYDNFAVGNPFLEKLNPLLSWNDLFHNYSENHDGPYREWLVANLRVLRKKRPHDFGLQTVKQKRMKSHNISVDTILAPPVPVSCQHPASWGVGARQGIQSESNSPTTAPNGKQNGKSSKVSASIPKDTFQFVHPASYSSSSMHYFAANLSAPSTNVISQTQMVKNKAPGMRGKKLQPSNSQSGEVKQNVVVVPPLDVFQLDLDIERMEEISMYLDTLNFVAVSELHNLAALEIGLERHRARKEHLQTSLNSLFFQLDPKRSEHAIYPRVRKHRRNSQHQNKRSTFSSATTTAVVSAAIVPSTIPEGNTSSLRVPSTAATSISTDDPDNLKKSR